MTDQAVFDGVFTAQRVFREVMDAFSHPLRTYKIEIDAVKNTLINGRDTIIKMLAFVFFDNTVSFYIHDNDALSDEISELTLAERSDIESADYVVIKNPETFDFVDKIRTGTLVDPHKGATVIIIVPEIGGKTLIHGEGPGIKNKRALLINEHAADFLFKTASLNIEYPRGFEIIFATGRGEIAAVPRRVKITGAGG